MASTGGRRRIRRGEAKWRRLVEEQAGSGLGQGAFCRERGLPTSSFQYWKRKLAASDRSVERAAPAGFVEVAVPAVRDEVHWDVELDLGEGVTLRLRRR